MLKNLLSQLNNIAHSRWYWLVFIVGGLALLAIALVYQYFFDELPCVMCIQVRLWIMLFVIVSFIGLFARKNRLMNAIAHISTVVIAIGLVERSYMLLGVERGFVTGSCNFDLGLPAWFAVEKWLPWMCRVETSCGYTPEIIFGITMAEGLMVMSICLLLVSLSGTVGSLQKSKL